LSQSLVSQGLVSQGLVSQNLAVFDPARSTSADPCDLADRSRQWLKQ